MKNMLYIVIGLMVFLNWDKISGMFGKKDTTSSNDGVDDSNLA